MRHLLVAALMVVSVGASLLVALAPKNADPSEPTTGSAMLTGADSPTASETKSATRTRTVRPITSDADGTRCVLGTGTANWIEDTALPYHCEHGYSTEPSTEHRHWRVKVAPMTLDRLRPRRVEVALY